MELTEQDINNLKAEGYFDIKNIPNRGTVGLFRFIFTVGLCYGIHEDGYIGRYCFPSLSEARESLNIWDGVGDPSGDWIKHKGSMEYSNPNLEH